MPTPMNHALRFGASSSGRWGNCPGSIKATAHLPDKTSVYAEEGTLAHELCELRVREALGLSPNTTEEKIKSHPLWNPDMISSSETYRDYILERISHYENPFIDLEVRVDFSNVAPGGFGTSDCVIIGRDIATGKMVVEICDYKNGQGVKVDAEHNSQMRLYALGTLNTYRVIYGDSIEIARTNIIQPRLNSITHEEIAVTELCKWAEAEIAPAVKSVLEGTEWFKAGDWCKFCKIKATCRERASFFTDSLGVMHKSANELSAEELGYVLQKAKVFANYVSDVEEYCTDQLKAGESVPGYKLVEGRSVRKFTDVDKAFEVLKANGIPDAMLYERKPITLGATEKLVGKKQFAELLADYVIKPPGKPVMVADTDKRPAINSAANDFKDFV